MRRGGLVATVPGRRSASRRRSRNGGKGGRTRVRADRHGLRTDTGAAAGGTGAAVRGVRAPVLPVGAGRGPGRPQPARPVRRRVAHWNLAQHRAPGEAKVGSTTRTFEQHGWQSPHTRDRDRLRRHAVHRRLGDDGPHAQGLQHPPGHPPGDADPRATSTARSLEVLDPDSDSNDAIPESILHAEVGREHDRSCSTTCAASIEKVLDQVRAAAEDWQAMRAKPIDAGRRSSTQQPAAGRPGHRRGDQGVPALAGRRQLHVPRLSRVRPDRGRATPCSRPSTAPGWGSSAAASDTPPKKLSPKAVAFGREPQILVLTKANSRLARAPPGLPRLHRRQEVRRRGHGRSASAASSACTPPPRTRPARARSRSSAARSTASSSTPASRRPATTARRSRRSSSPTRATRCSRWRPASCSTSRSGSSGWASASALRLFMWRDPLDRFVECLVCIPRDRFNTENRERVGRILLDALDGVALDWTPPAERVAPRARALHHPLRRAGRRPTTTWPTIEARLVQAVRAWTDDLRDALLEDHGEEDGLKLFKRYERAFPPGYQADWVARSAVADIARIEELASRRRADHQPVPAARGARGDRAASSCSAPSGVLLSDVLPTLEHLGAKVADERPYEITPGGRHPVWIYDFGLRGRRREPRARRATSCTTRSSASGAASSRTTGSTAWSWRATLTGRQISIVRAVAKYLRQARARLLGRLHRAHGARATPTSRGCWSSCSTRGWTPTRDDREQAERIATEIERGARRRPEPRRGPHPAQLPVASSARSSAPTPSSATRTASRTLPVVQARLRADPGAAAAPAAVRDLRLLAARRGRSTCAAARWPAAGSAGRTAARTSAPRSSA